MFALVVTLALASSNTADVLVPVSPATRVSGGQCGPATDHFINGSRSQFDPLGRGVWLIDDENDEVLLLELVRDSKLAATTPRALHRFSPGRWPEQLVVAPDGRVFVTARESGRVFVIAPDFSTSRIDLAPEPRSLALDVTHHRLYVGLVTSRELVALDSDSGAVLQRRVVEQPPDFLALSASGLLVASRRDDVLSVFGAALESRGAIVVEAPLVSLEAQSQGFGMFNLSTIVSTGFSVARRVRGVAALTATATQVSVVVEEAAVSGSGFVGGLGLIGTGGMRGLSNGGGGYGGGGGAPISHFLFAARAERDGVFIEKQAVLLRTSVVTELAVADDRTCVLSETNGPIQCFDAELRIELIQIHETRRAQLSSMVVSAGQLVIATRARELHFVDAVPVPQRGAFAPVPNARMRVPHEWRSESVGQLPPSRLDEQLRRGRALFHSADLRISTGGGLACVSCHPDGREDGRVWTQANTLRQTPMLADRLVGTAPYNWLGTSGTLEANIHQTIVERLGGEGLSKQDTAALSRFLLEGLRPVTTRQTGAPALVARGAELFADEEVGCAHCHSAGRQFTDGKGHDVKFVSADEERDFVRATGSKRVPKQFDTPSLTHLKVTAPYLHNGQVQTLAMLLETNHDRMGATTQLSVDEREALVAYLESL